MCELWTWCQIGMENFNDGYQMHQLFFITCEVANNHNDTWKQGSDFSQYSKYVCF